MASKIETTRQASKPTTKSPSKSTEKNTPDATAPKRLDQDNRSSRQDVGTIQFVDVDNHGVTFKLKTIALEVGSKSEFPIFQVPKDSDNYNCKYSLLLAASLNSRTISVTSTVIENKFNADTDPPKIAQSILLLTIGA